MKKIALVLFTVIFSLSAGIASAATLPTFPTCLNPQGTIKSTFDSGTHGIVGSANSYTGSDTVYRVLDNSVTQCFCGADGQGIQTNWWAYDQLTENEIQNFKNDGWIEVPNGLAWGLADKPYLAKNSNYSCSTSRVGGASDSKSDSNSGSNTNLGVLGLASTGNSFMIALLGFGAIFAFAASRIFRKIGK